MIHVTTKICKKGAHRTENNKIKVLAEFETSARQLPMKCPVTKKYISGPIGMPCLMWMEEQVGCSGKLLYACLICTFHYRQTNEGKSHSWPIGTGVFIWSTQIWPSQITFFFALYCTFNKFLPKLFAMIQYIHRVTRGKENEIIVLAPRSWDVTSLFDLTWKIYTQSFDLALPHFDRKK